MPQDFINNQLFSGCGLVPFGDKPLPKPKLAKFYDLASLGHYESMSDVYTIVCDCLLINQQEFKLDTLP